MDIDEEINQDNRWDEFELLLRIKEVAHTILVTMEPSKGGDLYSYRGPTSHVDQLRELLTEYTLKYDIDNKEEDLN